MNRWTLFALRARTPRVALATLLLFTFPFIVAKSSFADDAAAKAAKELARKLGAQVDHKKKLQIKMNDVTGSMQVPDLEALKKTIVAELHLVGFRVVADSSYDLSIQVTLSKNLRGLLLLAAYSSDEKESAVIVPFESSDLDPGQWLTGVHLDRELIFADDSPILDFACVGTGTSCQTLVLHAGKVSLMAAELNYPSAPIPHEKAWPRDMRGRLTVSGSDFEINVEGTSCSGNVSRVEAMKCNPPGDHPWIFNGPRNESTSGSISGNQNWFEWTLTAGPNAIQPQRSFIYSIAGLEVNGEPAWAASGADGKVRVFPEKGSEPLGSASGWGSDIATVKSDCGAGWQILATQPVDRTEIDAITAYELAGGEFRAVSDPMEMDGPIVAMWSGEGGGPARTVVRNLKTGDYEAYFIKVGCSR